MNTRETVFIKVMLIAVVLAWRCAEASSFPLTVQDDRGKEIEFAEKPRRIVSLAPTQTELLYSLGLEKTIVGVTSFCTYPDAARGKEKVGGFAEFDVEKIIALNPDLVLSFGTVQLPAAAALEQKGRKVFWIYPRTVNAILASIDRLGEITGTPKEAARLREEDEKKVKALREAFGAIPENKRPSVFRVMGIDPPATIGAKSFQSDVFSLAGGKNVFADVDEDFFEVDAGELIRRDPDVVVICGDNESAARQKLADSPVFGRLTAVKKGSVLVIPCDLTCRPGPRVAELAERLARGLHPDEKKR